MRRLTVRLDQPRKTCSTSKSRCSSELASASLLSLLYSSRSGIACGHRTVARSLCGLSKSSEFVDSLRIDQVTESIRAFASFFWICRDCEPVSELDGDLICRLTIALLDNSFEWFQSLLTAIEDHDMDNVSAEQIATCERVS